MMCQDCLCVIHRDMSEIPEGLRQVLRHVPCCMIKLGMEPGAGLWMVLSSFC
jgi:hypothetical protein